MKQYQSQLGGINISIVVIILLGLLLAGVGSLAIWLFNEYSVQRQTIEEQIVAKVSEAKNDQAKEDEEKYIELSKKPSLRLTGPDEFGRVTFDYPRNWDVYIAKDGLNNEGYEAYLNPGGVPPVDTKTDNRFALRVSVTQGKVDKFLEGYQKQIEKGEVKTSVVSANGHDGTRLDGMIEKDIRGYIVVYKVDDNVLTVRTDAETFKNDFDALIKTIDFK